MATELVRPGGNVANVGVHGKPVELHLEELWIQNINISMGLVNANTTPMLLKLVAQKKIRAEKLATHHFTFDQILDCLLYTSDAADDLLCVDLGGRRIIKKKKKQTIK